MANDVNIKGKISIDTGDSGQQVSNVKKGLNDLSSTAKDSHSNFTNLKESLSKLSPGFKDASEGVETLGKSFKALLLNPVVLVIAAIVAALVGLYKAFTSTQEGAEKMEQFFAGLKATMSVIIDRLVTFGNAIIKLFSGDFKGAADAAKASVTGLKEEIGAAYNLAVQLTANLQKIKMEELKDAKDQQRRKARLAELKEMVNDEDISIQERKKMAKELKTEQEKDFKEDFERSKKKSEAEIALIKNGRSEANLSYEDKKKINDLEMEVDKNKQDGKMEGTRINKLVRNLDKQESAAARADIEAEKKKHEELMKVLEEEQKLRMKIWWSRQNDQVTVKQVRAEEQKAEDEKNAKLKKAEDEKLARQKENLSLSMGASNTILKMGAEIDAQSDQNAKDEVTRASQRVSAYLSIGEAASAIGRLIGEQTAMGKGLGIAQATINTWVGVTEILKTKSLLPEPIATISRIANITAVVASGLSAVKNIMRTQVPGASGGGSSSGMSISSPIAPMQSSTSINQNSINGIGSAAAGGVGRVFVLDQDIKDSSERSARVTRAARLG